MKTLKADLQELEKSLKQLVRKTEQMGKRLNKLENELPDFINGYLNRIELLEKESQQNGQAAGQALGQIGTLKPQIEQSGILNMADPVPIVLQSIFERLKKPEELRNILYLEE